MGKGKSTPGPWRLESWSGEIIGEGGALVASLDTSQVNFADAKLIAAAPELLEALRGLYEFAAVDTHHDNEEASRAAFVRSAELLNRLKS